MSSSGYAISQNKKYGRIVLLVDMDCFYCQVEEKLDPSLKGKPVAVVQYNEWRGGGIIAVNYAARAQGVTRHMRGDEAKAKCPEIVLAKVPSARDKGNLNKYRDAGQEVAEVLQKFTKLLYRASVDEAYLDITKAVQERFEDMNKGTYSLNSRDLDNTFAVGFSDFEAYLDKVKALLANPNEEGMEEALGISHEVADLPAVRSSDLRLIIAATIANEIRAAVKAETSYECSAGIAHNKVLAKLACGINKPNKQTIMPLSKIQELFSSLPVRKIQGLGGKFGEELCEDLGVRYLGELVQFTEAKLQKKYDEKNGTWLYNICRGIDLEPVVARFHPKSIGCSKQFPGPSNVCDTDLLNRWLCDLADELCNRLDRDTSENNRKATQLVVTYVHELDGRRVTNSRSAPLNTNSRDLLAKNCFELIKSNMKPFLRTGSDTLLNYPIKLLGISAGKFEAVGNAQSKLKQMFANQAKKRRTSEENAVVASTSAAAEERQTELKIAREQSTEKRRDIGAIKAKVNCVENAKMQLGTAPENVAHNKQYNDKNKRVELQEDDDLSDLEELFDQVEKRAQPAEKTNKETPNRLNEVETVTPAAEALKASEVYIEHDIFESDDDDLSDLEALVHEIEPSASCQKFNKEPTAEPEASTANSAVEIKNSATIAEVVTKKPTFSELVQAKPGTPDYRATYAEFAVPQLSATLLFTKCETCGAQVYADARSLQSHQDHHVAQQLSQQLRAEYRAEQSSQQVKTKTTPGKAVTSSSKKKATATVTSVPSTSAAAAAKITKFFKSATTTGNASAPTQPLLTQPASQLENAPGAQEMLTCDKCNASVHQTDMAEHQDYHLAKELQKEFNRLEARTVIIKKRSTTNSKRKRDALNLNVSSTSKRSSVSKPIEHFFNTSQPNAAD